MSASDPQETVAAEVTVAAFYRFVEVPDRESWRERLLKQGQVTGLRGSILLAEEGINGTIAGCADAVNQLFTVLGEDDRFQNLEVKYSRAASPPFKRWKVKLKQEIVTMGLPGVDPRVLVGTYVKPEAWNALLDDPDVVVVDTRNSYEVEAGRFPGAVDPGTLHFRQFPAWADEHLDPAQGKRLAMYCTGGIRCEKATSYLLGKGFREVYHLEGGILKYLETLPPEKRRWEGRCYVFDERETVDGPG